MKKKQTYELLLFVIIIKWAIYNQNNNSLSNILQTTSKMLYLPLTHPKTYSVSFCIQTPHTFIMQNTHFYKNTQNKIKTKSFILVQQTFNPNKLIYFTHFYPQIPQRFIPNSEPSLLYNTSSKVLIPL